MSRSLQVCAFFALACALAVRAPAQTDATHRGAPWSPAVIEAAEKMPLQDGGRVKPLHTYASFLLLRLNGKRSLETPAGERLEPVPWLLDVLFFPGDAASYPIFMVQDSQAVEAIGVPTAGKKKRDRYTFTELRPGIGRLFELAREYGAIEDKDRSTLQQQVFMLAQNVDEYIRLMTHADFARQRLPVGPGEGLAQIFGGQEETTLSQVLTKVEALAALQDQVAKDPQRADEAKSISALLHTAADLTSGTESLALIPPTGDAQVQEAWHSPADLILSAFSGAKVAPEHVEILASFEALDRARGEPAGFAAEFERLSARTQSMAAARGEFEKVELEVGYYKSKLISRSLVVFILGFVLAAVMWLKPRNRFLYVSTSLAVLVATLLLTAAIVVRCLIRERPPVTTLYETVLFVTAVGSFTALVMEWINRQRIALSAAAALGIIGLFVANGYEMLDKRDTMPSLVAVLDTNFWLATHVTAITVGYSAGMLAALLANVYLLGRLLRRGQARAESEKTQSRMVYGTLCFGLVFSLVGTILGGIWANESWGRFWGWDPKENGALLICLSQLVILHARMGGYLRDFGVAMAAAFGGTVIAFSWWGVNLLGVGLHSYGFTSGIHTGLWTYYIAQWSLLGVAGVHYLIERARNEAARQARVPAGAGSLGSAVKGGAA